MRFFFLFIINYFFYLSIIKYLELQVKKIVNKFFILKKKKV